MDMVIIDLLNYNKKPLNPRLIERFFIYPPEYFGALPRGSLFYSAYCQINITLVGKDAWLCRTFNYPFLASKNRQ